VTSPRDWSSGCLKNGFGIAVILGGGVVFGFGRSTVMANIMKVLKDEIARIARKEAKRESTPARKLIAGQRGLIADLRRQVNAMQKDLNALKKATPAPVKGDKEQPEGRFWITGKGVRTLRTKLGLTQTKFGKLAGVSLATVVNWESIDGKVSIRRKDTAAKLQDMRGMGKRAVAEILGKPKRAGSK